MCVRVPSHPLYHPLGRKNDPSTLVSYVERQVMAAWQSKRGRGLRLTLGLKAYRSLFQYENNSRLCGYVYIEGGSGRTWLEFSSAAAM